ncbi:MAG TPA: hypothetical protein VM597_00280 [Gemmataceae bacterium]|jgi:hypothetical protein|nr:hypothetical protein [Gemmataceae bacterium]
MPSPSPILAGLEAVRLVARRQDLHLQRLMTTGKVLSEDHRAGILSELHVHLNVFGFNFSDSGYCTYEALHRLVPIIEICGLNARLDLPDTGREPRPTSNFPTNTAILISDLTGDTIEFEAAPIVVPQAAADQWLAGADHLDRWIGGEIAAQIRQAELPEGKKVGEIRVKLVIQNPV